MSRYTKLEQTITSDQQEAIRLAVGTLVADGCPITPEVLKETVQAKSEQLGCPMPPYLIVNRYMTRHGFQRYTTIIWVKPEVEVQ